MKSLPKPTGEFDSRNSSELPKGFDFASGIHRAGDCAKEMKHTFINGKPRGETTHIPELDQHFRWKPGFLYCNTGYPQGGKSEGTKYLTLIKSVIDGKKWGFYSPEEYPKEQFFDTIAQTYIGKSVDPKYQHTQMSMKEYEQAIEFIHTHYIYVYYKDVQHTPEFLRQVTAYLHAEFGIYGFIKDPWNKCVHKKGKLRDDEYLEQQLPKEQKQARELNIVQYINVHPVRIPREAGKPWPVPDQQHIAGGQMWDNMADMITAWHRPNYYKDKSDTYTEFHIHKVKQQHLMGTPGYVGFDFNRTQSRYIINGTSPLSPVIVQPKSNCEINNLPASQFEHEEPPF